MARRTTSAAPAQEEILHATIPLEDLAPHPRNYRRHPQEQLLRIAASLLRFGQVRGIVVQHGKASRYLIVAGHGLTEAARLIASGEYEEIAGIPVTEEI